MGDLLKWWIFLFLHVLTISYGSLLEIMHYDCPESEFQCADGFEPNTRKYHRRKKVIIREEILKPICSAMLEKRIFPHSKDHKENFHWLHPLHSSYFMPPLSLTSCCSSPRSLHYGKDVMEWEVWFSGADEEPDRWESGKLKRTWLGEGSIEECWTKRKSPSGKSLYGKY